MKINIIINSHQKIHTCKNEEHIITENTNNILTKKDEKDLAIKLIKNNIDQTPLWHINNFKINNINWSNNKIINLVYKLQEESYPTNKKLINCKI